MQVILLENVPSLGKAGDLVNFSADTKKLSYPQQKAILARKA
jgi:ribosomal protein L9